MRNGEGKRDGEGNREVGQGDGARYFVTADCCAHIRLILLYSDSINENVILNNVVLNNVILTNVILNNVRLNNVKLNNVKLRRIE